MIRYHAAWIVPIVSPPIKGGWVDIEDGSIVAVGSPFESDLASFDREIYLDTSVILPGLVNAHTHLELSGLKGCVSPTSSMPDWVRQLMASIDSKENNYVAIRSAIDELRRSGTVLLGDISNTLVSVESLLDASIDAVIFNELLGFNESCPEELVARAVSSFDRYPKRNVRFGLAAHSPYSVSPSLFLALREAADTHSVSPLSVHVAESREELEFLQTGSGPWREILNELGRWEPNWKPPSQSPLDYLEQLGWLTDDTLIVHGVHLTDYELKRMAQAGATLIICPRSNRWTGAGIPPIDRFYSSGVRIAFGTDSLASVNDLNLFSELHEVRRLAPSVPAKDILCSATISGAKALGFGNELGAIAPGYRAALILVNCSKDVNDVEEYLVSGVQPDKISWLENNPGC